MLQVLHFWQAKAMALQVAVQAARRRLNGKQPAQLPPIPPPPFLYLRAQSNRNPALMFDMIVSVTQSTSCFGFGYA